MFPSPFYIFNEFETEMKGVNPENSENSFGKIDYCLHFSVSALQN